MPRAKFPPKEQKPFEDNHPQRAWELRLSWWLRFHFSIIIIFLIFYVLFEFIHHIDLDIIFQVNHNLGEGMEKEPLDICESLKIMENIALQAEEGIRNKGNPSSSYLAQEHSLNNDKPKKILNKINQELLKKYNRLKDEPLIARITVLDEKENESTYYINRVIYTENSISYGSPIGRIASHKVGDEVEIIINGQNKSFEILERILFHTTKYNGIWDSTDTKVEQEDSENFITSLREFCELQSQTIEDFLATLIKEEKLSQIVQKDIKRKIIRNMSLRDQPILDKFQDDIFRLPLDEKLLILGPPGTGKTTTLIKRLGQKLDILNLDEDEKELIENFSTTSNYKNSWLMFAPTELLTLYVKEAFNKEGIPASDRNIKTWDDYRRFLTRGILDILKSETGTSTLILAENKPILKSNTLSNSIDLYEKFTLFYNQQIKLDLEKSNDWLLENIENEIIIEASQYIQDILKSTENLEISHLRSIDRLNSQFLEQIKTYQEEVSKVITGSLQVIYRKDNEFLKKLNVFIKEIEKDSLSIDNIEEDENDTLSKNELTRGYNSAIRSYARIMVNGKKLNPKSKNAKIIKWLDNRLMSEEKIIVLGKKINILTHLRKFLNPMKLYVSKIPSQYKNFRTKKENAHWYDLDKKTSNFVNPLEVDIILLLTLKSLNAIRATFSTTEQENNSYFVTYQPLFNEYRNQILVDEATDFSPIQLACMLELTNQKIRSFFACGDFNQRITTFGIQTKEEMKWISNEFDIREINIHYRQSKKLTKLAKMIVNETIDDTIDDNEFSPVLVENINDTETLSLWLKDRISEIEKLVEFLPSIAIFVNSEKEVETITKSLNKVMMEKNIQVKGYPNGQGKGQDEDIKVFNIKHIKGLEFEAVFFVNVDRLAKEKPLLFDKYLYVGVTRATTYLGISCEESLPKQIEHTRNMFIDNWDK